jgi:hypothetical protein
MPKADFRILIFFVLDMVFRADTANELPIGADITRHCLLLRIGRVKGIASPFRARTEKKQSLPLGFSPIPNSCIGLKPKKAPALCFPGPEGPGNTPQCIICFLIAGFRYLLAWSRNKKTLDAGAGTEKGITFWSWYSKRHCPVL